MADYQWINVFCNCNSKNKKPLISENVDFDHDGTKDYQKKCPSCEKMKRVTISVKAEDKTWSYKII